MYACIKNNLELVKLLVFNDANINETDSYGNTAILHNCKTGNFEILKFLCERGGNPLITNYDRKNALMMATNIEIMKYLLEHYSFDINEKSNHNNTALDYVLIKIQHQKIIENYNIIDFLLDNGAELDIHNYEIVFRRACEASQKDINLITLFFKHNYKIPNCKGFLRDTHIFDDLIKSDICFYMEIIKRYIFFFQPSIHYDIQNLYTKRQIVYKLLNYNEIIIKNPRFLTDIQNSRSLRNIWKDIQELILLRNKQLIKLSTRMQLLIYCNKIKTSPNKSNTKCGLLFRTFSCVSMKKYWLQDIQRHINPLNRKDIDPNIQKLLSYP